MSWGGERWGMWNGGEGEWVLGEGVVKGVCVEGWECRRDSRGGTDVKVQGCMSG